MNCKLYYIHSGYKQFIGPVIQLVRAQGGRLRSGNLMTATSGCSRIKEDQLIFWLLNDFFPRKKERKKERVREKTTICMISPHLLVCDESASVINTVLNEDIRNQ